MRKHSHYLWKNEYWDNKRRVICKKCRESRRKFGFCDLEDSPIFPGFYNRLNDRTEIFFVLESLGKKKDEEWPKTPKDAIEYLWHYYRKRKLLTFHQSCIRKILDPFNSSSYIVSDVVKCYVEKKKRNFDIAVDWCSSFLKGQIFRYQPKIIVPIGKRALTVISNFTDAIYRREMKKITHGESLEVYLTDKKNRGFRSVILYCIFPSGWTADSWIKNGGHKPVVGELSRCLSSSKFMIQ